MSHIWVPKFKIVEPKDYLYSRTNMEGWYRLKVHRPDGRLKHDTGWFHNVITDVGLDLVGTTSAYLQQCRVGTGNTAPAVSDTGLVTQVGTTTSVQADSAVAQPSAPYYGSWTRTWRFTPGTATGNLAEIGVGVASGGLFSRALILDGGGSPTTITVLADEYLDASYQLRFKPPLSDVVDTINISGTVYDRITRAGAVTNALHWAQVGQGGGSNTFNFTHYTGNIAAITTLPSGSGYFSVAQSSGTYSAGTYFRNFGATVGLPEAVGTTRCVGFRLGGGGGMGSMQTQFDNGGVGIVKTSSQVLTWNFQHVWARGTP